VLLYAAWLDAIPAIVRILLVFTLVLLAIKRKWSLGSALLGGALLLGLAFAMAPGALLLAAGGALLHPKTLSLAAVVALILVFSHTLEKAGQMQRLLDGFRGLIRRPRINLVVFPALIGLLPMPGGAIFSAPMVKSLGQEHRLTAAQPLAEIEAMMSGRWAKRFQASQEASTMASWSSKTLMASQLARRYCQTCSTGLSSGLWGGSRLSSFFQ